MKKPKLFNKSGIYTNKKTGHKYKVLFEALNCTNAQDGQEMVCYVRHQDGEETIDASDLAKIFVREKNEFFEKFE